MKKSSASSKSKLEIEAPAPLEASRTVGLLILLLTIIFTVVWLGREGLQDFENSEIGIRIAETDLARFDQLSKFDSRAWYLPADETYGFVEIAAGEFTMGSNPLVDRMAYGNEQWSRRERQGQVELPTFYISRFETTVAQFSAYLADTGIYSQATNLTVAGDYPVTGVTWPEAMAYSRWLQTKLQNDENLPNAIREFLASGAHATLPSEAEWEKAARGTQGRVFPWGARARTDVANFNGRAPLIVGALPCPACINGLSDMSGNVWEMTSSPLQDYPYTTQNDADDLTADALWVMRGGSYQDEINNVRAAVRGAVDPGVRSPTIGFRVVLSSL